MSVYAENRILIVEDDGIWQKKISLLLKNAGYQIEFAASYDKAFQAIQRGNIDLICLDIILGRMKDGWKLDWTTLLGEAKNKKIDVVVITGMPKSKYIEDIYEEALEFGVRAVFFKKQISRNNLLKKIEEIILFREKTSITPPILPLEKFDVFLAHNHNDKPQIEAIAKELRRRGLNPWLDKEQILPGRWFQDIIQKAISEVKSAAIFIGPSGLGKWQIAELRTFIRRCVEADIPAIPVLLPGVKDFPKNLLFLKELHCVRFIKSVSETKVLDDLEWGITGKHPKRD